jgi:PIN domain nuclease of toxin-antitoxin system
MKTLLDTHTFIWFIEGSNQLSENAKVSIIEADVNYLSIASMLEIAIKVSIGSLKLNVSFKELEQKIFDNGFLLLNISFHDSLLLSNLPFHHRDPFDRIIISQSISNELTLVSADKNFKKYNTKIIW